MSKHTEKPTDARRQPPLLEQARMALEDATAKYTTLYSLLYVNPFEDQLLAWSRRTDTALETYQATTPLGHYRVDVVGKKATLSFGRKYLAHLGDDTPGAAPASAKEYSIMVLKGKAQDHFLTLLKSAARYLLEMADTGHLRWIEKPGGTATALASWVATTGAGQYVIALSAVANSHHPAAILEFKANAWSTSVRLGWRLTDAGAYLAVCALVETAQDHYKRIKAINKHQNAKH
jgi:hypothetical protein